MNRFQPTACHPNALISKKAWCHFFGLLEIASLGYMHSRTGVCYDFAELSLLLCVRFLSTFTRNCLWRRPMLLLWR